MFNYSSIILWSNVITFLTSFNCPSFHYQTFSKFLLRYLFQVTNRLHI
nr:MAG TPA: hypothetical protein [Caudoviricetes sp.]